VQSQWMNDGDPFGLGVDADFLAGGGAGGGKMTIPGDPPLLVGPRPQLVTTRGGDYFFVPSIPALRWLGEDRGGRANSPRSRPKHRPAAAC
jgi:hypothetical protein